MGKNDNNRYDTNKKYADSERKKERKIKSPISVGSRRSKEKDALRKVKDKFSLTKNFISEEDELDELDEFDDFEE